MVSSKDAYECMDAWCSNHTQDHTYRVHRFNVTSMRSKVLPIRYWSKRYHLSNKVLEVPGVYILPSDINNFLINSVISNILKKNSSEHNIAWQLFSNYSVIASALHLKGQDGFGILQSSVSGGSQVESSTSSRLLGKRHYSQRGLHWVRNLMPPFLGLLPQS